MKTILVDQELEAMQLFECEAERLPSVSIVGKFDSAQEALQYTQSNPVDLAVMNIRMPDLNGIELGKSLRETNPDMLFVYIADQEDSVIDTLRLRAAAYVLKPYVEEDVRYALGIAELLWGSKPKHIFARTFGSFDLFLDGRPIVFKSAKAKELLALLIDRRGGIVDSEQMIATLWEGRPKGEATLSLCSKLCKTLYQELEANGISDLVFLTRSGRSVNLDALECDLYDLLDGKEEARRLYCGEYMRDYDWAEYRNYSLSKFL